MVENFKTTVSQTSKRKTVYRKSELLPLSAIYWSIRKMSTKENKRYV